MKEVIEAANKIRNLVSIDSQAIGVILGSGLGEFCELLEDSQVIPYSDIPHFVQPTVTGHSGELVIGKVHGRQVLAMKGRFHFYEGHDQKKVVLPVRVLAKLGIKSLIMTNAAGGINETYHPGDLVLIQDHLNLTGQNPLIGHNYEEIGPRFPDMSEAYPKNLQALATRTAERLEIDLKKGVYVGWLGPSYETPAEIRMMRLLGGDLVGMSTVPEVIAANHAGMNVLGISCVTNYAAGISDKKLSHEEVKDVANQVMTKFSGLVKEIIKNQEDK